VVLPGEGVEAGQNAGELGLRPTGDGRGDPDQDLHLKQRLVGPELPGQRLAPHPLLHQLGRRGAAATAIASAQEVGQLVSWRRRRPPVASAPKQPPPQAPALPRSDRQEIDADRRAVAAGRIDSVDRAGEARERIGIEAGGSQRLAARPCKDQLSADDLPRLGLGWGLGGGAKLDALVGGHRRAQSAPRPLGHLDAVAELPGGVGVEPQPDRARRGVEQAANRSPRPAEAGGEADDGLGGGIEGIGGDREDRHAVIESPASDNEPRDEHRKGEHQQSPGEADGSGVSREPPERYQPLTEAGGDEQSRDSCREKSERDCVPPV
jgi:hypothetical protein